MTYDIFISYRREGADQADRIYTRLQSLGYRVFMDVEALNSGKFNEQLLSVIAQCKDFLLILPPNALDRCSNPDGTPNEQDWVRREVMCAMAHKKNIIPIMLTGFVWPEPMPEGMEELCMYQAITPLPNTYYDMQIKKLQGYLKSKAHFQIRKRWLTGLGIVIMVIAILMIIARITYMPVAQQIAEAFTIQTQCMNDLSGVSSDLQSEWENYVEEYKVTENSEDKVELKKQMTDIIDLGMREKEGLYHTMRNNHLYVNAIYFPMLWIHGINPAEIWAFNNVWESFFNDLDDQITAYTKLMENDSYTKVNMYMAKIHSTIIVTYANSFYYACLQMLTHLPKSTHKSFYDVSHNWQNLPTAGIGWSDEEYERQQKLLDAAVHKELAQLDLMLKQTESELEEQDEKLDKLEKMAYEVERTMDTMEMVNQLIIQQLQQQNEP